MSEYLAQSRAAWIRASQFPADKEAVYPEHAEAQEFDTIKGLEVLEYGCGGGSDAFSFLRRGNYVTAVDIVPGNILETGRRARELGLGERLTLVSLDDSVPLPFANGLFDVVSSHGVLHHILDVEPVIQELVRVLKPGGRFYCMLYTEQLYAEYRRLKNKPADMSFAGFTDGMPSPPYARAYDEYEGTVLLSRQGLYVGSTFEYNNQHFRTYRATKL